MKELLVLLLLYLSTKLVSTELDELDERDELEVLGVEDNKKRPGFPSRSFYRKFMITSPHV
jgi:hypothetical protein